MVISTRKTILIASSSRDEPTCGPVAALLRQKGYKVILYEADKVATGETPLRVRITDKSGFECWYDGKRLDFTAIGAAWCRRPGLFGPWAEDRAKQQSLDTERQALQSGFWATIPEHTWLNAPHRMQYANHKLLQLQVARTLGFTIPDTLITNRSRLIPALLPKKIIFKGSIGILQEGNTSKYVYTTVFTKKTLPAGANPFPGMWQAFVPKKREWRVTIVGEKCFAAAIYTSKAAKDDWRRIIDQRHVRFKSEQFPVDLSELCQRYLKHLGLRFGAFDFIEDTNGNMIFLECNPNGQYGWLEADLGFPVSEAIASELARIAGSPG